MLLSEVKIGDKIIFVPDKYTTQLSCYLVEGCTYTVKLVWGGKSYREREVIVTGNGVEQAEYLKHFKLLKDLRKEKLNKINGL